MCWLFRQRPMPWAWWCWKRLPRDCPRWSLISEVRSIRCGRGAPDSLRATSMSSYLTRSESWTNLRYLLRCVRRRVSRPLKPRGIEFSQGCMRPTSAACAASQSRAVVFWMWLLPENDGLVFPFIRPRLSTRINPDLHDVGRCSSQGVVRKVLGNRLEMGHNQGGAEGCSIEDLEKRAVRAAGHDDA